MKKLEDISKENIYKVPEGYFDKLPGMIQARVAKPEPKTWFPSSLKFALPIVVLGILLSVWLTSREGTSIEERLNEIQTEQLMAYLDNSELSIDLITEEVDLNEEDFTDLEEHVFSSMEPITITVEELNIEPDNF